MTTQQQTKRRIMRDFEITELSAVDHPAQGHARATILKRAAGKDTRMDFNKHSTPRAFDSFDAAVAHIRQIEKCSGTEAMQRARLEHPALVEKHNAEAHDIARKATGDIALAKSRPRAQEDFNLVVSGLVERLGISRSEAMRRARRENPDLFRRLQEA